MNNQIGTTYLMRLAVAMLLAIAYLVPQSASALKLKPRCLGEAIKHQQIDRTKPIATYHGVYRPNGKQHWQALLPLTQLKRPTEQEAVLILRPKNSNECTTWKPVRKHWFGQGKVSSKKDLGRSNTGLRIAFSLSETNELIPTWLAKHTSGRNKGQFKGITIFENLVKQGFDYVAIDELSGNASHWNTKNLRNFRDFLKVLKAKKPALAKRIILYVDTYKSRTAKKVASNGLYQQIIGICANACRIIASEVYSQAPCYPKSQCTERLAKTISRGGKKAIARQTISVFTATRSYNGATPDSVASINKKYTALKKGKISSQQPGAGAYPLSNITSSIPSIRVHARALRDANNKHAAFVLNKRINSHGTTTPQPTTNPSPPTPSPTTPLTMSQQYPTIASTVEHFYRHLLGRTADHGGREGFVRYVALHPQGCGHVAYAAVVNAIAQSPEFNRRLPEAIKGNKGRRLTLLYRAALFREPDANGWQNWANAYGRKGWKWSQIVGAFVSATAAGGAEFRNQMAGRC